MQTLDVFFLILKVAFTLFCAAADAGDLTYLRSFKLPKINSLQRSFHYSNGPLTVHPTDGRLLIRGHANFNECAFVAPPEIDGATATLVGPWFDPTYGIAAAESVRASPPPPKPPVHFYIRGMVITDEDYVRVCLSRWYNVVPANESPFITGDLLQSRSYGPWNGNQHSLRLGGYITRLSPDLQAHFGVRYGGAETSAQGVATSHDGPALSVFDFPANNTTPFGTFPSTKVCGFDDPSPYPGWWPSHQINSVHSLPDRVLWIGRRGFTTLTDVKPKPGGGAAPWHTPQAYYGLGTQTFTKTDGTLATVVDETAPNAQGYHSDDYECRVISLPNARIKAGNIVAADYAEQTLPECNGRNKVFYGAFDARLNLLYVSDAQADGDQPMIRVYKE